MTAPWPDDMVAELRGCIDGGLSSGRTAVKLGLTRSAVIGKAARLHLTWGNSRGGAAMEKARQERVRKPRKSPQVGRAFYAPQEPLPPTDAPRAVPPAPNSKPVDLMGLTNSTCRWPLWETDRDPHLFCGALEADNINGVVYCEIHRKWAV